MSAIELAERMAQKYSITTEEFIQIGTELTLKERKRKYLIERFEILSRYESVTVQELREKIEQGVVREHPAWEDLIEIKNIDKEIEEIEDDLKSIYGT